MNRDEVIEAAEQLQLFCEKVLAFFKDGESLGLSTFSGRHEHNIHDVHARMNRAICLREEPGAPNSDEDGLLTDEMEYIDEQRKLAEKYLREYIADVAVMECATAQVVADMAHQLAINEAVGRTG